MANPVSLGRFEYVHMRRIHTFNHVEENEDTLNALESVTFERWELEEQL